MKDRLKARGYRWSDGTDGNPRAWYRDVAEEAIAEERQLLATEIYPRPCEPRCVRLTAFDRFSRSEEHTSELQSLMRLWSAVFCLKKKKTPNTQTKTSLTI